MALNLFLTNVHAALANPLPPPSINIAVHNAPFELKIILLPDNRQAERINHTFDSYFIIYISDFPLENKYLKIISVNKEFELNLILPPKKWDYYYILDLENQTLVEGKPSSLFLKPLVSVALTLAIEGLIFFLFGFRKKISWFVLFFANILTQGVLYFWLIRSPGVLIRSGHSILNVSITAEIGVVIAELIVFYFLVREYSRLRVIIYVLTANIASLFLGEIFFRILPI
jgi:hypothetical protein